MFFSRKLEMSGSTGNLTSPMIRLFLIAHGPLTEGNVTTFGLASIPEMVEEFVYK
jgi:hypothetical protein